MLLNVVVTGDGRGDGRRLRKGLFDDKLAVRPGDGSLCESVVETRVLADWRSVVCLAERFKRAMSYHATLKQELSI